MSAPWGVPLCAPKNESLSKLMRHFEIRRHGGGQLRAIFTVDVEPNRLSPDALIIRLALEELVFDGSHQVRIHDVGANDEIRSIHFEHLTMRFPVDIFVSTAGGGETARREEVVQILGRYGGEIYESGKTISLVKVPAYEGSHTHLGFFLP